MPSIVKARNEPIICKYVVESKRLNGNKMNVKSNLALIIRVQGKTLVSCTGAELPLERKFMMSKIYFKTLFFFKCDMNIFLSTYRNAVILVSVYLFAKKKST